MVVGAAVVVAAVVVGAVVGVGRGAAGVGGAVVGGRVLGGTVAAEVRGAADEGATTGSAARVELVVLDFSLVVSGVPTLLRVPAAITLVVGPGQPGPAQAVGCPDPPNACDARTTTIPVVGGAGATHRRQPPPRRRRWTSSIGGSATWPGAARRSELAAVRAPVRTGSLPLGPAASRPSRRSSSSAEGGPERAASPGDGPPVSSWRARQAASWSSIAARWL